MESFARIATKLMDLFVYYSIVASSRLRPSLRHALFLYSSLLGLNPTADSFRRTRRLRTDHSHSFQSSSERSLFQQAWRLKSLGNTSSLSKR